MTSVLLFIFVYISGLMALLAIFVFPGSIIQWRVASPYFLLLTSAWALSIPLYLNVIIGKKAAPFQKELLLNCYNYGSDGLFMLLFGAPGSLWLSDFFIEMNIQALMGYLIFIFTALFYRTFLMIARRG